MCKAWKDDLKSMMLPSGKDHYRIRSYHFVFIARRNTVSDELRSIGQCMLTWVKDMVTQLAKFSPHPLLHDAGTC